MHVSHANDMHPRDLLPHVRLLVCRHRLLTRSFSDDIERVDGRSFPDDDRVARVTPHGEEVCELMQLLHAHQAGEERDLQLVEHEMM
jgi:hypothetical protein